MAEKSYHHGELKSSLIKAAKKLLQDQGADSLSLRSIASAAGVSHMAPYAHFKNKRELIQAIVASGFEELADMMEKNSQGLDTPYDQILTFGATYIEFAISNPQLYRLMVGQVETAGKRHTNDQDSATEGKAMSPRLDKSAKRTFSLLQDAFSLVYKDQETISAQAFGAWATVHGMAALIIEGHFTIPKAMTVKEFLSIAVIRSP